jgi:hypothetical protein
MQGESDEERGAIQLKGYERQVPEIVTVDLIIAHISLNRRAAGVLRLIFFQTPESRKFLARDTDNCNDRGGSSLPFLFPQRVLEIPHEDMLTLLGLFYASPSTEPYIIASCGLICCSWLVSPSIVCFYLQTPVQGTDGFGDCNHGRGGLTLIRVATAANSRNRARGMRIGCLEAIPGCRTRVTVSHKWRTRCSLRGPISLVPSVRDLRG